MRTRNRSFRVAAAAVGAGAMLSTPVLLALATPASAAGTPATTSTAQSAAAPAANPCPAIRVFNLEGTGAFNGLAPGTAPPPDFQAAAAFAPDRALTNLSQASGGRADYFTINYPAAGGIPIFASERAGVVETERQATTFLAQCSTSKIELLGYSQGAWVAGDVATDIANNTVPGVTPDKLVASFLVGDPVNQATQRPGFGTEIGPRTGVGPLTPRFAGFGANSPTTFEFCNPGDNVCDAPPAAPGPAMWQYLGTLAQPSPAHTQYDSVQVAPGTSTVQWIRNYGTADGRVVGAIRAEWLSLGGPTGFFLGAPLTNELTTPGGVGRYTHFQGGSIYWSPASGAHEVHGAIRDAWTAQGWEAGSLGFPVSDEFAVPGGRASAFQGGTLTYSFATGQVSRS